MSDPANFLNDTQMLRVQALGFARDIAISPQHDETTNAASVVAAAEAFYAFLAKT